MEKHCDLILQHMKTYGSINPKEAENEYGCMRLAARIKDLRNRGVDIETEIVKGLSRNGAKPAMRCTDWGWLDDVIEIKKADMDSHFKLLPCKCGSDNVAYVHYNGRGGAKWRVTCFDCGHTVDKGHRVRHDAQIAWNGGV